MIVRLYWRSWTPSVAWSSLLHGSSDNLSETLLLDQIKYLTWTFSFLLEKSGANIALEQKLSKSGPVFSK